MPITNQPQDLHSPEFEPLGPSIERSPEQEVSVPEGMLMIGEDLGNARRYAMDPSLVAHVHVLGGSAVDRAADYEKAA